VLKLSNITLVALSSKYIYETVQAMKYSMRKINFADCIFISHKKPFYLPKSIKFQWTSKLRNIDDYNYKMLFEIHKYIKTEFVLIIQYDGFVIHPDMWQPVFLNFDYIGSPWPEEISPKDFYGNIIRVGNGGASLRSRKILELPSQLNMPFKYGEGPANNEDVFICARYRHIFLEQGVKYAPLEIAKYFGHEETIPELKGIKPFLFHKWWNDNINYKKFGRQYFDANLNIYIKFRAVIVRIKIHGVKNAIKYYFNKCLRRHKNGI
jgi:hypothetical protein